MSHGHGHETGKKLKKWLIAKRNKRDLIINQQVDAARQEAARVEAMRESLRATPGSEVKDAEVWSAKTQEVRNRLTGKKRAAEDRWNRFAGTAGGGGKGL